MEQIVKILNIMYMGIQGKGPFMEPLPEKLFIQMKIYISSLDSG